MARDQEPVTEEEFDELRAEMAEQREQLYEALAEDLGGDPDEYRVRPCYDDAAASEAAAPDGGN